MEMVKSKRGDVSDMTLRCSMIFGRQQRISRRRAREAKGSPGLKKGWLELAGAWGKVGRDRGKAKQVMSC